MNSSKILDEIEAHCRHETRGACTGCPHGTVCGDTLIPKLDRLLVRAHELLAAERGRPRDGRFAELRRLVDELSLTVLDSGRVSPMQSIEQALGAARRSLGSPGNA